MQFVVPETGRLPQESLSKYTYASSRTGPWNPASATSAVIEATASPATTRAAELSLRGAASGLFKLTCLWLYGMLRGIIFVFVLPACILLLFSYGWQRRRGAIVNQIQLPPPPVNGGLLDFATYAAFAIGLGLVIMIRWIFNIIWALIQALHPANIVVNFHAARTAIANSRAQAARKIRNLRFNSFTDWLWLRWQQGAQWIANHTFAILVFFCAMFCLVVYFAPKDNSRPRWVPPPPAKSSQIKTTSTPALPSITPKELLFADETDPNDYWGMYKDAIKDANEAAANMAESIGRAKSSPSDAWPWEALSYGDSSWHTAAPGADIFEEENFWDERDHLAGLPVRYIGNRLEFCMMCRQWHAWELPY